MCYAFPPFGGIGGRRWEKFTKELLIRKYCISVISAENDKKKKTELDLFNHIQLPLLYPKALINLNMSFLNKIKYQIALVKVKLQTKGNYYDRTINWKKQTLEAFNKINSNKKITHCIVSGAPFYWLTFIPELKAINSKTKFISDIRDPWTNNKSAYGFTTIGEKRFSVEKENEIKALESTDHLICVNKSIAEYFIKISKNKNIQVIENGFDTEEMKISQNSRLYFDNNKINLVFTGSIYNNTDYLFVGLITELTNNIKKYLNKIHFYFYGPTNAKLKKLLPDKLKAFFTFGYTEIVEEVNQLIYQSNYCVLFLSDDINNSLSTKFCEYIKLKKKIIVFGKEGFTSNYIINNKLGQHINQTNITSQFEKIINQRNEEVFPDDFNINQFSIKTLTDKLEKYLN
jgi:hypothetical protein